jgi:hypothetical protein
MRFIEQQQDIFWGHILNFLVNLRVMPKQHKIKKDFKNFPGIYIIYMNMVILSDAYLETVI